MGDYLFLNPAHLGGKLVMGIDDVITYTFWFD
jgi:hypothetical protein